MIIVQAVTGRTLPGGAPVIGPTGRPSLAWPNFGAGSTYLTDEDGIGRDARLSPDGIYRYWLKRTWHIPTPEQPVAPALTFIMLNPSTADAERDDPTIRKCMAFAHRDGYGGLMVLNLFAWRATDPAHLRAAALRGEDVTGPVNDRMLANAGRFGNQTGHPDVVCAWGNHGSLLGRDKAVRQLLRLNGAVLKCLGTNKDGSPKHPLYLAGSTPLEPFA